MRILMIGGTGFIGAHILRYLLDEGHEVMVFHRGQTEVSLRPTIQHICGDRRARPAFAATFRQFSPHVTLDVIPILLGEAQYGWRWTRGYVENVARAVALAVTDDRAAGRIYNIGAPEALTEAEWVRAIGRAAAWDAAVVAVSEEMLPAHLAASYDWRQPLNVRVVATYFSLHQIGDKPPVPVRSTS